jgi:hypothetical protein
MEKEFEKVMDPELYDHVVGPYYKRKEDGEFVKVDEFRADPSNVRRDVVPASEDEVNAYADQAAASGEQMEADKVEEPKPEDQPLVPEDDEEEEVPEMDDDGNIIQDDEGKPKTKKQKKKRGGK